MNRYVQEIINILNNLNLFTADRRAILDNIISNISSNIDVIIRDSSPGSLKNDLKEYITTTLKRKFDSVGIEFTDELKSYLIELTDNTPTSQFVEGQRQSRSARTVSNFLRDNNNALQNIVDAVQNEVQGFLESKGKSISPAQKGQITRKIKQRALGVLGSRELSSVNDVDFSIATLLTTLPDTIYYTFEDYVYFPWSERQELAAEFRNRFSEETFAAVGENLTQYVNEGPGDVQDVSNAEVKSQYIDNVTDEKLQAVRQKAFDSYQELSNISKSDINIGALLDNIRIEPSMLYEDKIVFYYNKNLFNRSSETIQSVMEKTVDGILTELKTTVADNNSVFQIEISREVMSDLGENARHSNEIQGRRGALRNDYGSSNSVGSIDLVQIYYPEENEKVLNKFTEWFDSKVELLDSQLDNDFKMTNIITSDGPKFVSKTDDIVSYKNMILSAIRRFPELQYILDTAYPSEVINNTRETPFKWEIIGSNQSNGQLSTVQEIHKEGLGQWFRDILNLNPDNVTQTLDKHPAWNKTYNYLANNFPSKETLDKNKYAILDDAPSWVYGLVHTGPDGKKRIISIALSDSRGDYIYENDLGYNVSDKSSSISTNFISWKPISDSGEQIVYGYYPNVVETLTDTRGNSVSINKILKKAAVREAQLWFGGMMAVADADGIVCVCSPINAQVANIYQRGGFIAESISNLKLGDTPVDMGNASIEMTRIPGNYRIIDPNNFFSEVDGWSIMPPVGELEFIFDNIETNVWSRPSSITGKVKRYKYLPGQIESSPRHKAILSLSQIDVDSIPFDNDSLKFNFLRKINTQLLKLSGLTVGLSVSNVAQNMTDAITANSINDLKYVYNNVVATKLEMQLIGVDNKKLGEALFNSTLLEKITGIDTNLLDDDTKKSVNILIDTSYKVDTGTVEPDGDLVKIKTDTNKKITLLADILPEEKRKEVGIYTKEELLQSVNEGLDADKQLTELSNDFVSNWYNGTLSETDIPHSPNTLGLYDNSTPTSTTPTTSAEQAARALNYETFRSTYESSPNAIGFEVRTAIRDGSLNTRNAINRGFLVDELHWTDVDETATGTRSQIRRDGRPSPRQGGLQRANLFERLNPYANNREAFVERISPRAQHRFVHLLNELSKRDGSILLTADIDYVGHHVVNNKAIDYFEIGTIKQITRNGETKLVKNYMTIAVDFNDLNYDVGFINAPFTPLEAKILSVQQIHPETDVIMGSSDLVSNRTFQAFNMLLNDSGITTKGYRRPTRNTMETQVHPVGRVGRAMGIIARSYDNRPTILYAETTTDTQLDRTVAALNNYENDPLMKNEIKELTEQSTKEKKPSGLGQIVPQPLYTTINFLSDLSSAESYNYVIQELFDLVDNKTTGAVAMEFKISSTDGTYTLGTLIKRHGQAPKFIKMSDVNQQISQMDTDKIVFNPKKNVIEVLGKLDEADGAQALLDNTVRFSLSSVELTAPDKDFTRTRVIQNAVRKIEENVPGMQTGDYFSANAEAPDLPTLQVSSEFLIDETIKQPTIFENRVANLRDGTIPLVVDENLPRIHSSYSLGRSIGRDGGTDFVGQTFNPNRPPVGLDPDTKTLRQLAKAFAKTKTGKTLGYGWKAIDIGETLINQAFKKAGQAAAAAGALSLGTGVAALATLWATWEIGNLIIQGMKGIPDLYNVYERRNEILANGEYWEKQLVEETFWKDYGGELLDILQEAAKYSPSERLGDAIWSFALDNLTRQSQGESFPEIYEEDDSELDMKDDIYYSKLPNELKLQQMQNSIDYDKVLTGYYNNRPEANVIINRTYELANNVYNRDR